MSNSPEERQPLELGEQQSEQRRESNPFAVDDFAVLQEQLRTVSANEKATPQAPTAKAAAKFEKSLETERPYAGHYSSAPGGRNWVWQGIYEGTTPNRIAFGKSQIEQGIRARNLGLPANAAPELISQKAEEYKKAFEATRIKAIDQKERNILKVGPSASKEEMAEARMRLYKEELKRLHLKEGASKEDIWKAYAKRQREAEKIYLGFKKDAMISEDELVDLGMFEFTFRDNFGTNKVQNDMAANRRERFGLKRDSSEDKLLPARLAAAHRAQLHALGLDDNASPAEVVEARIASNYLNERRALNLRINTPQSFVDRKNDQMDDEWHRAVEQLQQQRNKKPPAEIPKDEKKGEDDFVD